MPVDWMPVELIPCNKPTEALHAVLLTHQLVDTMVQNETGRRLHNRWLNTEFVQLRTPCRTLPPTSVRHAIQYWAHAGCQATTRGGSAGKHERCQHNPGARWAFRAPGSFVRVCRQRKQPHYDAGTAPQTTHNVHCVSTHDDERLALRLVRGSNNCPS